MARRDVGNQRWSRLAGNPVAVVWYSSTIKHERLDKTVTYRNSTILRETWAQLTVWQTM